MINDLEFNVAQLQLYDQPFPCHSFHSESIHDLDVISKKIRVSSLCYHLKKKIRRKPSRPSLQKIDDGVRNVKIFSLAASQNNLDNLENEALPHH